MKSQVSAIALASVLALSASFSALSADLGKTAGDPTSASYEAPVSWTGFTIGAGVNYSMLNHEISTEGFEFDGISSDGVQGVAIIGYQQQLGNLLAGVEGRGWYGDVSTDLTLGDESASLELDYAYAVYAKLGVARGAWAFSGLAGYKWQHYELTGGEDDTVGGFSGGVLVETKLDDRWNLGLDVLYTRYDDQEFEAFCRDFKLEPSQLEATLRLTYQIGGF